MKKNIILVLITAVVTVFLIIVGFTLFGQTPSFSSTLSDGYYIAEGSSEDNTITLSVENEDVVVNWNGRALSGTVDKTDKTMTFIDNDEKEKLTYKLIAGKVVLNFKGTEITFKKQKAENNEAKATDTSKKAVNSKSKDLTVGIVEEKAKEAIGLIPEQADDLLSDLEYYEYENSEVSISIDFEDEAGDYVSNFDDKYKVTKVLNVVKTSDDYITVTFIVEPK